MPAEPVDLPGELPDGPPGELPGELRSLDEAIAALRAQRAVLGDRVVDTAVQPLVDKRDRLLAASVGEQRKQVSVLFADLVDSTPVARLLDPEDLQQVMSRYSAAARAAVEAEGGVVEKFIGDAVMAVFGLYRSREDDAVRAVRAARALQQALQRLDREVAATHGVRLRIRIGIDTGEVVVTGLAGQAAGQAAGEFIVVGDTVNRAARLQSAAAPGTVLLSADTAGQVRGGFGLRRLTGLELKGIEGRVDAYVVLAGDAAEGDWPEPRGIEGVRTRTVGRGRELRQLQQAFTDVAREGTRRTLTVLGEAGIGKSRMVHDVEEWLARLPTDVWVLRGRATPATQDVANGLLRSVFAERFGIRGTDDPGAVRRRWVAGWAELVGDGGAGFPAGVAETVGTWLGFTLDDVGRAAVGTTDPEVLRRRGTALVLQLLDRLVARAPVVVLLEDLHWADSASLDSARALAEAPGAAGPLLVLATARPVLLERRPSWGGPAPVHSLLRLAALSTADTRALVGEVLQCAETVPAGLVDTVVATADGNPYYVEELVTWLVQQGTIDTGADRWRIDADAVGQLRVPTSLRGLLQSRLDALPPSDRGVLGCAAVVGRVFWDQAVARLAASLDPRTGSPAGSGTEEVALERLTELEVVFRRPHSTFAGSQEFSFRHALLRDVAYEGVLRSARRTLHALAARWLADVAEQSRRADEHAAAVAFHHEEAGAPVEAARWYLRAGRYAAGTFANEDALRVLGRAQAHVPAAERALWCDVLLARETVLDRLGRREEQRATLDELTAADGLDPARRALIRLAEGRWLFYRGHYAAVPPVAEQAADLARQAGRRDLQAEALMQGGRSLAYLHEDGPAREQLGRSLAEARALGDSRRAGEVLRLLGVVATNQGENEEALRLLAAAREEHRAVHDREGEAMVAGQVGALLTNLGRLEEARVPSEEALAVFQESGHRYREGIMLTNLAQIALEQGRLDDALDGGRRALLLTEEIDDAEGVVASLQTLGDGHRLAGELPAAREELDRGLQESRRRALPYFTAHLLASLSAVDLAEGRLRDAVDSATRAQQAASGAGVPHAEARADLAAGTARQAIGDPAAVPLLLAAAQQHGRLELHAGRLESLAVLALAHLGCGEPAAALQVVEELLPELDGPYPPGTVEPGRVLVDVHRVLVAAGDARAAAVAARAGEFLRERSGRVRDGQLRARFLATPVNRELARIAAAASPQASPAGR